MSQEAINQLPLKPQRALRATPQELQTDLKSKEFTIKIRAGFNSILNTAELNREPLVSISVLWYLRDVTYVICSHHFK